MKKLLITTVTHGDEGFAVPIVEKLAARYGFEWRLNNPRAYQQNTRFFQKDLNRSGPGNPTSPVYEERLAYCLIKRYSQYSPVIDVHGSVSNCGVFALVSEPSTANIELAKRLDVTRVILWPALRATDTPLTQFIPSSLEIECGPKNAPRTARELSRVLTRFVQGKTPTRKQQFYIVTGFLPPAENLPPMKDFQEIVVGRQTFTPLLVDQYPGIKCYMLQKFTTTLAK